MKAFIGLGVAISLVGCVADEADIEDGADDVFLTDDAKADAFGVEDWSPDGAAVLRLVSTASEDMLDDDVGLSAKAAASIVKARKALPDKKFTDLAQLDAAPYVGTTVFKQLLKYVTAHHLFKTSLRVPLVVENEDTNETTSIASYNTQAHNVGLQGFARYTFVDKSTDYEAKIQPYNERIDELEMKANIMLPGDMLMYAYNYAQYSAGSLEICYIGDGRQVNDVIQAQAGVMVGEMYSVWAWRYKTTKWMYDEGDEQYGDDFANYNTSSDDVLIVYSNDDDGTHIDADVIPRCR